MTLGDKTRRVWAILLFVILGPAVLLTVTGIVCHRRGGGSVREEEKAIFDLFHMPAALADVEFVRPGTNSYFGLSLTSFRTGAPFLFCPEILARPAEETDSLPAAVGNLSAFGPKISECALSLTTESEPNPKSKKIDTLPRRTEWLIPNLYLRQSDTESLRQWLGAENGNSPSKGGVNLVFRVGRIHLMKGDADFDRVLADYRRPKRRFGTKTIAALTEKDRRIDHELGSEETLRRQITEFISHPTEFVLEEGEGIFLQSERGSLFAFAFRPEGMTAMEPARFVTVRSWDRGAASLPIPADGRSPAETSTSSSLAGPDSTVSSIHSLYWGFDCSESPIPTPLAAVTAPVFSDCGDASWLTGIATATDTPTPEGRSRRIQLQDFTIRNVATASFLKRLTATRLEGTLHRLTIQNGEIQDGVFIGQGRFHLVHGRLSKDFLVRFQKEFALDFLPKNTLTNHFPDDMIPFTQIAFGFDLGRDGVRLHAPVANRSGMAGEFKSDAFGYQFFLPPENEKTVPYPRLLSTLSDGGENPFWTPFYRDALNHLPTGP